MIHNYQQQMEQTLAALQGRPRLLLHSCCGPCSSAVIERLAEHFELTVYYHNPNIYPESEYRRRAEEQARLLERLGVPMVEAEYDPAEFEKIGMGDEPEGGARCKACYALRLEKTAQYAKQKGFAWFCSTLSVSPHKNAVWLNELGQAIAHEYGLSWLPNDFKKKNGFLRSLQLSEEYGLYRQSWCGCRWSWQERKEK
jgi:predicted adenine nucleotide alpha hydrolase (AANH) superfamily ATPase